MTTFTPIDDRLAKRLRDRLDVLKGAERTRPEGLLRWYEGTRAWSQKQRRTVRELVG